MTPIASEASEPATEPVPEEDTFFNEDLELNVNVLWGRRIFGSWDDSYFSVDMDDLRYQQVMGLEVDFGKGSWPFNIWLGYTESEADISLSGYRFESKHTEYFVGARIYLLGLYVSGAVASIGGDYTGTRLEEIRGVVVEKENGLLLSAGIDFTVLMLNTGFEARALVGTESNNYILFGVKLGFHLE